MNLQSPRQPGLLPISRRPSVRLCLALASAGIASSFVPEQLAAVSPAINGAVVSSSADLYTKSDAFTPTLTPAVLAPTDQSITSTQKSNEIPFCSIPPQKHRFEVVNRRQGRIRSIVHTAVQSCYGDFHRQGIDLPIEAYDKDHNLIGGTPGVNYSQERQRRRTTKTTSIYRCAPVGKRQMTTFFTEMKPWIIEKEGGSKKGPGVDSAQFGLRVMC